MPELLPLQAGRTPRRSGAMSLPHPVPAFVIDLAAVEENARQLAGVAEAAGCTIVMALKAFACPQVLPVVARHIPGVCASGPWEARLGHEEFHRPDGQETLIVTCSPAYTEADLAELLEITHILDFNSLGQWQQFRDRVRQHPRFLSGALRCGLRINPGLSTQTGNPLYDPCAPGSRLGAPLAQLQAADPSEFDGLHGLHFHSLCEQGFVDLAATLDHLETHFAPWLGADWCRSVNFGGGHWITKPDYDRAGLIARIREFRQRWGVEVILEPGEAFVIHTGVLVSRVLDLLESGGQTVAILDVSATAHMPDTLEMPYRPDLWLDDAGQRLPGGQPEEFAHTYSLGGPTCLAGDSSGRYSFSRPLAVGDLLVFDDMAHYTLVKTTMFNGVRHPAIVLRHPDGRHETVREFHYEDFRSRLG